ncbi:hypothetical protein [Methanobacterium oryzae]|uniref:hypothetical protein n=1 Tax=Methanobacterium oryzae TaxID=69540 RepID=UPI003D1BC193
MHKENDTKEARLFPNFDDQNEVMILFEEDNKKNSIKYIEFASEKNLQKAGIKKLETNFLK